MGMIGSVMMLVVMTMMMLRVMALGVSIVDPASDYEQASS